MFKFLKTNKKELFYIVGTIYSIKFFIQFLLAITNANNYIIVEKINIDILQLIKTLLLF